ncbi:MAG: hypothetical protein ACR2NA_05275 [Solirubrobacterales bacterium]
MTVPEDVYREARIRAAERDTSVSALVAGYLRSLGSQEEELQRLERRQRELVSELESFTAGDRLDRDELHRRAVR